MKKYLGLNCISITGTELIIKDMDVNEHERLSKYAKIKLYILKTCGFVLNILFLVCITIPLRIKF
jgi:uncharacterized membrane protein